jgi:hypothetical protein
MNDLMFWMLLVVGLPLSLGTLALAAILRWL